MKYLARALLMLAIVAVSLVAFTFAAPVQAGSGGVSVAFHCQGPDVWGSADIYLTAPTLANPDPLGSQHLFCNSAVDRGVTNDPPQASWYYVILAVYVLGGSGVPDNICADYVYVGSRFQCDSPFGSQKVTLQIR